MEVVILAGGLGTRLRSVVSEVPKCMAPVSGKPFLWHLFQYLSRYDVSRVVLSVGYLREVIFRWVEEISGDFRFKIDYAVEETPLGTGGGIRLALSKCADNDVAVLNGDTFFDVDLSALLAGHRESGSAVTMALKSMTDFDRYGAVEVDGVSGRVDAFREKSYRTEGLINGGVYCVNRRLLQLSSYPVKFSFEKDVLEPESRHGRVSGVRCNGYFIDIGIPEDYKQAGLDFLDVSGYDTLLLDRDGVINRLRRGDYVKTWDEFEFLPGFLKNVACWSEKCRRIIVVTNQRGVGKGLMTDDALNDIHRRMVRDIENNGGRIDAVYCCTSVTEEDPRRKPGIGMYEEICRDFPDVPSGRTLMVGDSDSDEEFAAGCGINFMRV